MPVSLDSSTSRVVVAVRGEACLGLGQRDPGFGGSVLTLCRSVMFVTSDRYASVLLWVGKSSGQGAATKSVQKA